MIVLVVLGRDNKMNQLFVVHDIQHLERTSLQDVGRGLFDVRGEYVIVTVNFSQLCHQL